MHSGACPVFGASDKLFNSNAGYQYVISGAFWKNGFGELRDSDEG